MVNSREKKLEEGFIAAGIREVELARNRVGKSRVAELKWLLSFAYTDLGKISEGRRTDLMWEAAAFSFGKEKHLDLMTNFMVHSDSAGHVVVNVERVVEFQAKIRQEFDAFLSPDINESWKFETPAVSESLKIGRPPQYWEDIKVLGFPSIHRRRIRYATDLLKAEQDRVRICDNPKCGRAFVTRKKDRGRFCKPGCNAYTRISVGRILERLESQPGFSKLKPLDQRKKRRAMEIRWRKSMKAKRAAAPTNSTTLVQKKTN